MSKASTQLLEVCVLHRVGLYPKRCIACLTDLPSIKVNNQTVILNPAIPTSTFYKVLKNTSMAGSNKQDCKSCGRKTTTWELTKDGLKVARSIYGG